jgi:predicted ferric reductase
MILQKKNLGWLIIISINLLIVSLWVLSKSETSLTSLTLLFALGEVTALLGAALLSLNYVLSARLKFVEPYFGGLDKMYKAHRLLGSFGFVAVCFHPVFLAMNSFASVNVVRYFIPSSNIPYALGVLSLYAYIFLIVATAYLKLPYHIWKLTHQMMGVPLVLFALHIIFIPTSLHNYLPLQIALALVIGVGILAYFYKLLIYHRWGPKYDYHLKNVIQLGEVTELILKPRGKPLIFNPGQFVFVSFNSRGVGKESHPFSVSSGKDDDHLRLSIKSLGDYTDRIRLLQPDDKVQVYGPYGSFEYKENGNDQVWIAGGIGITPFLSMLRSVPETAASRIWLFYCTRSMRDASYLKEIMKEKKRLPSLNIIHHASKDFGRINHSHISKRIATIKNKEILLCGSKNMMENLIEEFMVNGVRARNIHYEDFSFLT